MMRPNDELICGMALRGHTNTSKYGPSPPTGITSFPLGIFSLMKSTKMVVFVNGLSFATSQINNGFLNTLSSMFLKIIL